MIANTKHIGCVSVFETIEAEALDIVHLSAEFRQASGHRSTKLRQIIAQRLDDLMQLLLDHFDGVVTADQSRELLKEHHPLTQKGIAKLPSGWVPLVVMRELISVHLVPVERTKLTNWPRFFERYHAAI